MVSHYLQSRSGKHHVDYCTVCDANYAAQAITLYRSLARYSRPFTLWLLALNPEAEQLFAALRLPNLRVVAAGDVERAAPELLTVKPERSIREYCFTLKPFWMDFLFAAGAAIEHLIYVDSDLCFFADPAALNADAGRHAVGIAPHRFLRQWAEENMRKFGAFNAGWISMTRCPDTLACLAEWKRQCLDWCFDRPEDGKFADQKYVDAWPAKYDVYVSPHPGANLAAWNFTNHTVGGQNGCITVDDEPLLFYHFSRLKRFAGSLYSAGHFRPGLPRALREAVYRRYIAELQYAQAEIERVMPMARNCVPSGIERPRASYRSAIEFARALAFGNLLFVRARRSDHRWIEGLS